MTRAGIDPSINSTGVCILQENEQPIYYIIVPKMTKKMKAIHHNRVEYLLYNKCDDLNDNIRQIAYHIKSILEKHSPDEACIESPSFNSNGQIVSLSILNGYIRCILDLCIVDYQAVPPTSIKKAFTANGQADKELMEYNWSKLDPEMYNVLKDVKKDDIADAYAMAAYSYNK